MDQSPGVTLTLLIVLVSLCWLAFGTMVNSGTGPLRVFLAQLARFAVFCLAVVMFVYWLRKG